MSALSVGLITYDHPHLKTEQVFHNLVGRYRECRIYALPFSPRPGRRTLIKHRPSQSTAVHPRDLAEKHGFPYLPVATDAAIDDRCDLYLILGAGILSADCVRGKRILNCHPGIIPESRGLDAFKWAIYDFRALGNTLHFVDEEIDAGEIISIVPTPVYPSDSLETLARRHYEHEIWMLSNFEHYLESRSNPFVDAKEDRARKRMGIERERELEDRFDSYLEKFTKE